MKNSTSPSCWRFLPLYLALIALDPSAALAQPAKLAGSKEAQAERLYDDAQSRFSNKDYAGAIIQLKNAVALDSRNLSVQVLLGRALVANGSTAAAEVALNEALRLGVNRSEVVLPLARALIDQGKLQAVLSDTRLDPAGLPQTVLFDLLLVRASAQADLGDSAIALKSIAEARAINPSAADSWVAEVPVRLRARQLKEAQVAADRAVANAPGSAEAVYMRGQVAHLSGDRSGALASYDKCLKISPNHVEGLVSRAGLLLDLGKVPEAERDVEVLVKTSKTEPRAWYLKALIAERQGKRDEARKALNDITALLDPVPMEFLKHRPQVLMLGGLSHYGLGQFEKARPYLEAVQRSQPNGPVNKLLAEIYLRDKNLDRAVEMLDGYARAFPGDSQAAALLASVHMAQGRYARAVQVSQDALKRGDVPALHSLLGMGLLGTGRVAGGVEQLEEAVRKDPGQLQAGATLVGLYLNSGQPARALKHAEALLQRHPKSAPMHHLVGSAKAVLGDATGAKSAYEEALRLDAKLTAPVIGLAKLAAARGDLDAAVRSLTKILELEPKNVDAMLELAMLLERHGRIPEAQKYYERADDVAGADAYQAGLALIDFHLRQRQAAQAKEALKRVNGKAPEALAVLTANARVLLAAGDPVAAKSVLNRATTLANLDAAMLTRIAALQTQAGNLPGAQHAAEKAVAERPDYLPALAMASEIDIRLREFDRADRRIRQIVAKLPKQALGHALLGDLALAKGQVPAALDAYRKAQQVEPSADGLLRLYGVMTRGDAAGANALAQAWLKTHPNDATVHRALGDGLARAGNFGGARTHYEAALKVVPDDTDVLNNLAHILIALDDPKALAVSERALALRPEVPHIIGTAGWAAFKSGQADKALQRLRDARLRAPDNPDIRYLLAAVLASAGKRAEAREELQAALRDGKPFQYSRDASELQKTLN